MELTVPEGEGAFKLLKNIRNRGPLQAAEQLGIGLSLERARL
jgi:hypothetical protein